MYLGDSPVKALVRKTRLGDDQDGTILCLPDQNQVYLWMLAQKPCIWDSLENLLPKRWLHAWDP